MSNYKFQYEEYYNNLKKKHNSIDSQQDFNRDELFMYRGSPIYKENRKCKNESFISTIISIQLVGTMILFLFAFGCRYSSNQNIKEYYKIFKNGVEQEYTYADAKVNLKDLKIDYIKNKFLESIDCLKEKLINDDSTY